MPDDNETINPPQRERRPQKGIGMVTATLAISLFIVCFDNNRFWWMLGSTVASVQHPRIVSMQLFLILFGGLNVTLALSMGRVYFKITAAAMLIIAAAVGFYMSQFGVAIDTSIIRSVFETDAREATTLLSAEFFFHIALYGLLPALVVLLMPLKQQRWTRELASKGALIVASVLVPAGAIYANYLELSFYGQAHRQIRLFMNPLYPVYATGQYVRELFATQASEIEPVPATGASRIDDARTGKPLAVVLVLGETARADHWSLNGYDRDTNAYTADYDVVNFPKVTACGTSTADSLPCIFSPLPHAEFSHVAAAGRENMLSLFRRLTIDTLWIDNSTGCKGICDDRGFVSVAGAHDPSLCDEHGCYDELLVSELARRLPDGGGDTFVVLHQRGSHGPTYYQNVPQAAKKFLPECTLDTFRDCDDASLINAYDNTILYTDRFLAGLIDYLETLEDSYDVAMLYVSDHGESLGENGLYLHGFPYLLAPESQKRVPMLLWASTGFYERSRIDRTCLDNARRDEYSHDSIFHTSLGLMEVDSDDYRQDLDALAGCRGSQLVSMTAGDVGGVAQLSDEAAD